MFQNKIYQISAEKTTRDVQSHEQSCTTRAIPRGEASRAPQCSSPPLDELAALEMQRYVGNGLVNKSSWWRLEGMMPVCERKTSARDKLAYGGKHRRNVISRRDKLAVWPLSSKYYTRHCSQLPTCRAVYVANYRRPTSTSTPLGHPRECRRQGERRKGKKNRKKQRKRRVVLSLQV